MDNSVYLLAGMFLLCIPLLILTKLGLRKKVASSDACEANSAKRAVAILNFCESRALDVEARLKLFESICATVRSAHSQGLVLDTLHHTEILVHDANGTFVVEVAGFYSRDRSNRETRVLSTSWRLEDDLGRQTIARAFNVHELGKLLSAMLGDYSHDRGLVRICRRATAIDPEERYCSIDALHEAVIGWLTRVREQSRRIPAM